MVEATGGVFNASSTSIDVRVPYAMGVVCGNDNNSTHVALLPVDSAMYSAPGYSGYAWRGGDGVFHYKEDNQTKEVGTLAVCNTAQILVLTTEGAKVIKLTPVLDTAATYGTPVFLYRKIRYSFGPSVMVPGTTALWRTRLETNTPEELSAPYDENAKFRFFVGSSLTAQDDPPADLTTIRGIELDMIGMSERAPSGDVNKQKAPFITAVFFKNRLD
jgi:hypothetical protein